MPRWLLKVSGPTPSADRSLRLHSLLGLGRGSSGSGCQQLAGAPSACRTQGTHHCRHQQELAQGQQHWLQRGKLELSSRHPQKWLWAENRCQRPVRRTVLPEGSLVLLEQPRLLLLLALGLAQSQTQACCGHGPSCGQYQGMRPWSRRKHRHQHQRGPGITQCLLLVAGCTCFCNLSLPHRS